MFNRRVADWWRLVPTWIRAWAMIGVGFIVAFTLPAEWLPSDESGLRRFSIEIEPEATISQTFLMTGDEFYAIELSALPAADGVSGAVEFALHDLSNGGRLTRRKVVPATDLVRGSRYRLEFDSIPKESRDQLYRLDVRALASNPARGVALMATKGEGYTGGSLFIDERERWADLTFVTHARGGRSPWRRLMEGSSPTLDAPVAPVVLIALIGYWIALGVVLRAWLRWSAASAS